MTIYLYYLLLGVYCIILAISIFHYLTKKAPTGDATVDWAWGIFYSAGLAGIILIALLLWSRPGLGLVVLMIPCVFYFLPVGLVLLPSEIHSMPLHKT